MQPGTVHFLNHPMLLEAREDFFARLEQVFAGVRAERPFVLSGVNGTSPVDPYTDPEGWVQAALDNLSGTASFAAAARTSSVTLCTMTLSPILTTLSSPSTVVVA